MSQPIGVKVDRLDAIRSHLYANGFSTIQALADATGSSLATVRRDLQILEEEGAIDRVHGGARIAEGSSVEIAFQEREKQHLSAKRVIATAAYELLHPRSAIFLDAGTTVLQLARLIRINPLPLRIFTNGLTVAQEFLNIPNLEVVLLGGQLRSENASLVGPQAEAMLDGIWFDQLFLGVSAISPDGAIYSVDSAEASLNRHMLARSANRFVLADSSKFGTMATYKVAPLNVAQVITDSGLAVHWRDDLAKLGVATTIAELGGRNE
ncbi:MULTISPECIES: DeoR/GlpR family DNA-binding transcription regulator [Rhizobium]|jgi:DeoR family fructose operon transcriptional repressor|uniref:DeoR/GlpR family DNA-binding transcription regulator n=1 Tax=Rhizobium TaxID=379 RepID=UPI0003FB40D0|nr:MULTISPECIES: DeoR/GlpR family DNA-binding transcription regulator [unclassified Rhizobium]MBD9452629.1 DeoR/GlpR transcriptional regulator [Rhizobium sp. RHZ02]NMN69808.1 DeoR family transcriptional regulator [Rhizobium sp. 57MFTsu3.2]